MKINSMATENQVEFTRPTNALDLIFFKIVRALLDIM